MGRIGLLSCLSLFMVFSFFLVMIIPFLRINKSRCRNSDLNQYKYLEYNPSTNETFQGFVSSSREVEDGEFVHYEGPSGNHVLISNFGSTEYFCEGSCSCSGNTDGRRITSVITRGVGVLVVAVTTILAFDTARKYFERDCVERMKDECSLSSVKSEIDNCERISPDVGPFSEGSESNDRFKIVKFFCRGNCMYSQNFRPKRTGSTTDEFEIQRHLFCEVLELSFVEIEVEMGTWDSREWSKYEIAHKEFLNNHLKEYCHKNSRRLISFITDSGDIMKKRMDLCVGSHRGGKKNMGVNPSISCVVRLDSPHALQKKEKYLEYNPL